MKWSYNLCFRNRLMYVISRMFAGNRQGLVILKITFVVAAALLLAQHDYAMETNDGPRLNLRIAADNEINKNLVSESKSKEDKIRDRDGRVVAEWIPIHKKYAERISALQGLVIRDNKILAMVCSDSSECTVKTWVHSTGLDVLTGS